MLNQYPVWKNALVAVVLLAVVAVPVLMGLWTVTRASAVSRASSNVETALINAVDRVNRADADLNQLFARTLRMLTGDDIAAIVDEFVEAATGERRWKSRPPGGRGLLLALPAMAQEAVKDDPGTGVCVYNKASFSLTVRNTAEDPPRPWPRIWASPLQHVASADGVVVASDARGVSLLDAFEATGEGTDRPRRPVGGTGGVEDGATDALRSETLERDTPLLVVAAGGLDDAVVRPHGMLHRGECRQGVLDVADVPGITQRLRESPAERLTTRPGSRPVQGLPHSLEFQFPGRDLIDAHLPLK